MAVGIGFAERGLAPDFALRVGIRGLLGDRLQDAARGPSPAELVPSLRREPIAVAPDAANRQHYELPPEFFELVLGRHRKYSCGWWADGATRLEDAERRMLELTAERAGLADGQEILELGCGWGSLSLWMAGHFPGSRILAVSNSARQREYLTARAPANLTVVTADMNDFQPDRRFDRVVSVEMFEHLRNWPLMLERIAGWLRPEGRVFVHHFCHREYAYRFEAEGDDDWMARHFFTGGIMPSRNLLALCADHLTVEQSWEVPGTEYQRTAEAWLKRLDARRADLLPILAGTYGADQAERWFRRWRMFFLACAELFGFRGGSEWFVVHHALKRRS